jgi:hypothetical protein
MARTSRRLNVKWFHDFFRFLGACVVSAAEDDGRFFEVRIIGPVSVIEIDSKEEVYRVVIR